MIKYDTQKSKFTSQQRVVDLAVQTETILEPPCRFGATRLVTIGPLWNTHFGFFICTAG